MTDVYSMHRMRCCVWSSVWAIYISFYSFYTDMIHDRDSLQSLLTKTTQPQIQQAAGKLLSHWAPRPRIGTVSASFCQRLDVCPGWCERLETCQWFNFPHELSHIHNLCTSLVIFVRITFEDLTNVLVRWSKNDQNRPNNVQISPDFARILGFAVSCCRTQFLEVNPDVSGLTQILKGTASKKSWM